MASKCLYSFATSDQIGGLEPGVEWHLKARLSSGENKEARVRVHVRYT
jgi:hypothetical protein